MIYIFKPFSTLIFRSGFCRCICSFTCFTPISKYSFCKCTCSFTCFTFIFKFGFYITTCGVGASLSTCCILIFNFGFCKLSSKLVFYKKSSRLDQYSSILISKYVIINTTSMEPKNFEQRHNCYFTLALRNDILRKYYKH
jgi:hypothetical protein